MNNTKRLLVIIVLFVAVLVGAYFLYTSLGVDAAPDQITPQTGGNETSQQPDDTEEKLEQKPAPDVTFYDLEGNAHKLSDYFGKPIVLNFWASWCGPCQDEMPHFESKYLELGEEVQFLMVNMTTAFRETYEDATAYMAAGGYTFPVFYDIDGEVQQTYSVSGFPTTYFLNEKGQIKARANGGINAETLQEGIDIITQPVE